MKRTKGSPDIPSGVGSGLAKYVAERVIAHLEESEPLIRVMKAIEKEKRQALSFNCDYCHLPVYKGTPGTIRCRLCHLKLCGRSYYCTPPSISPHLTCNKCGNSTCDADLAEVECATCKKQCCSNKIQKCCNRYTCFDCTEDFGVCPLCGDDMYL